ncbi:Os10g0362700 [Oryza sativa Japonica Group]|jgi:hypothetical protein|uniref:Expressed protein n=4 Tax=Oryza TaxID=4527 RepID=Q8S6P0_ORYSJ|nr:uncharacterized protein LOC4348448 [Oryza sativa Japonica Group]EAY78175.1 hypothetical protein OsI_33222 [Oryza sativa Indica Group]AAM18737.1 hypothetical protein [Oryza sativa Japonica Group]AAP53316.1 expressed protein [Oryza sativa Japonica Group]EAZ15814.1 hypothetical protein OsJ_31234 [Oryza sativa Japonica Group]KAF2913260.1 hypothetical protein DAI22_10g071000 [Oryza sativa Japonica Group]|eukprot:NP_001064437.1 Os10g0362700 [Oryza sativa Japonica Group]
MRRQGGNCEVNSSIALLQERFRNLQKVREMREGREQLLQTPPSPTATATAIAGATTTGAAASSSGGEQPRWFSHPELVRPSSRPAAAQRATADDDAAAVRQPPAVSVGRAAAMVLQSSGCRSDVEVDTSLHL